MAKRKRRFQTQHFPIGFGLTYKEFAKRRKWDCIDGFNHEVMRPLLEAFHAFVRTELIAACERAGVDYYEPNIYSSGGRIEESAECNSVGLRLVHSRD
jgi:hypothetical protein